MSDAHVIAGSVAQLRSALAALGKAERLPPLGLDRLSIVVGQLRECVAELEELAVVAYLQGRVAEERQTFGAEHGMFGEQESPAVKG